MLKLHLKKKRAIQKHLSQSQLWQTMEKNLQGLLGIDSALNNRSCWLGMAGNAAPSRRLHGGSYAYLEKKKLRNEKSMKIPLLGSFA